VTAENPVAGSSESRRRLLLELFRLGLDRVDGRSCVARELTRSASAPTAGTSAAPAARIWIAAVGKAASAMVLGAYDALSPSIERVLLITKDGHVSAEARSSPGIEIYESSHPVPDGRSLEAGAHLLRWVDALPADAQPLFLVSGGASSLVEVLEDGVTFADLARINSQGLAEGVPIGELNARRARVSRIKGGRLAARLQGRQARALFISDVPGDDPSVIGSGLMGPAPGGDRVQRTIVASVGAAVDAVRGAALERGLRVGAPGRVFDGDAVRLAIRFAHELQLSQAQLCVWGGESTLELPANPGRGGRNQHLALAAARLISGQPDLALLAAGTDGTDGPTEDAGGVVDGETVARISLGGLDADRCLASADSNAALAAAGDLVHTGPTGTNVGDLVIGLNLSSQEAQAVLERHGGTRPPML
jgi:glycerate 2-kinase